ncbi:glucans biosynthesis protein [Palleronia aestuarii]|uniref:Glucans biosynthesis protein n=1 Tax=Palleronia aestuarii TaxID=568105 RepID=A0A2W7NIQ5_9RHOB|nr:glucan biosynthesis protein G [Palleronia aestuarii]PZX16574.1 glucans biosynthesis protein [Palleronia aestuarii]
MTMSRRSLLACMTALGFAGRATAADISFGSAAAFGPETVRDLARQLAKQDFVPTPEVPKAWTDINYDAYRKYWFRGRDALFADSDGPLHVDMLHPGLWYAQPVRIDVVQDGTAREVMFDIALFDRTDDAPDLPIDDTLGYSGIRLRAQMERPGIFQEFAVFQGASYFRAIARGLTYGLSARGLAVGTATEAGEEFPDFTRLWIEAPAMGSNTFRIHALLDSPSVTGAFRFDITPGDRTDMSVDCTLFPRVDMAEVGIAPLTSMFLFDETNRGRFDDYRSAVHDSDGLLVLNGAGEPLWRPLANPRALQVSAFLDENPKGFGLMQRARKLSDFGDFEAHYQDRPGLWITPQGDWGRGSVALVEIPIDREYYDNIVAYWRPREGLTAGTENRLRYSMRWAADPAPGLPVTRVIQTRIGASPVRGQVVTIDFAPHEILPSDLREVEPHVSIGEATLIHAEVRRNPETGGARMALTFDPGDITSLEMRAQLGIGDRRISEVWLYRWTA